MPTITRQRITGSTSNVITFWPSTSCRLREQAVFIENVGNLVCPASFDLGQHLNVTLLSTPEGHDKPAKYPVMFRAADLVVITKADLMQVLGDFDPAYATSCLRQLASQSPVLEVSARSGSGLPEWLDWIGGELARVRRGTDPAKKISGDAA